MHCPLAPTSLVSSLLDAGMPSVVCLVSVLLLIMMDATSVRLQ